jgi:hypothetical protein
MVVDWRCPDVEDILVDFCLTMRRDGFLPQAPKQLLLLQFISALFLAIFLDSIYENIHTKNKKAFVEK